MKTIDLFAGIGGLRIPFDEMGYENVFSSEIDKYASETYSANFGHYPSGDITETNEVDIPAHDLLLAGFPCFTAGNLVLTEQGYRPIENIEIGDMVMTHKGRLRRVLHKGEKLKQVGIVKGVGILEPLTCTKDHRFLSVDRKVTYKDGRQEILTEPEWIPAENLAGKQWCSLINYDETSKAIPGRFNDADAMYLAGLYLGDGHIRNNDDSRKKVIILSLNEAKYLKFKDRFGDGFCPQQERTSIRPHICDTAFAEWLLANFGHLSHTKTVPAWVLGHPYRKEFLQGYLDTDGSLTHNGVSLSTTSRAMAYGVAALLNAEDYVSTVGFCAMPETTVIEGRIVNQRSFWQVRGFHRSMSRKSRVGYNYILRKVTSYTQSGEDIVYDIEVEDDHSFIVQGVIVHNCQSFSIMGKGLGFADTRGTMFFEIERILKYHRPRAILLENVKRLATHDSGRTLDVILLSLKSIGYFVKWKVLNALDFGLPQKRERILIAGFLDERAYTAFSFDAFPKHSYDLKLILEDDKDVDPSLFASPHIAERRKEKTLGKTVFYPSIWHENKSGNISVLDHACALRTGASYNYLLVNGIRRPTSRELLRLQGFPDSYKIVVSHSEIRRQTGNSVPVNMIRAVAIRMNAALNSIKY